MTDHLFMADINIYFNRNSFHSNVALNSLISLPDVFLGKGVLKIYSKFTEEHPCQSVILIKLLCNVFEIALRHGCSPVNLLHIFRTPFYKNTCGGLLPIAAEYWKGLKDIGTFETSWVQKQPPEKFCKKRCF